MFLKSCSEDISRLTNILITFIYFEVSNYIESESLLLESEFIYHNSKISDLSSFRFVILYAQFRTHCLTYHIVIIRRQLMLIFIERTKYASECVLMLTEAWVIWPYPKTASFNTKVSIWHKRRLHNFIRCLQQYFIFISADHYCASHYIQLKLK